MSTFCRTSSTAFAVNTLFSTHTARTAHKSCAAAVRARPVGARHACTKAALTVACVFGLLLALPAQAQQSPAAATSPATAAAPAAATSNAPAEYRLGAGDVVRITVFQNPELTLETRVTESGLISYPLVGSVQIGGQSVTAAEKVITDSLRNGNFVRNPQVTVVVMQVRGNQVNVLGQVNRPGRYPLEVAGMRVTDVLSMAGGTAQGSADIVIVTGSRNGQTFRTEVDLPSLFAEGGASKDPVLANGDAIWVDRQPLVYIYGEVQRPGPIRLERSLTLMQALATGGGLTQRGTEKGIRVHRKAADGSVAPVDVKMDDRLREGDVVFVRESLF